MDAMRRLLEGVEIPVSNDLPSSDVQVSLTEYSWNSYDKKLSVVSRNPDLDLGSGVGQQIALVSPPGSGKTRYLLGQGVKYFCIYLTQLDKTENLERFILAHLAVLERLPEVTPSQWLALQVNRPELFTSLVGVTKVGAFDLQVEWGRKRHPIPFVAIDNADHLVTGKRGSISLNIPVNLIAAGTKLELKIEMDHFWPKAAQRGWFVRLVGVKCPETDPL